MDVSVIIPVYNMETFIQAGVRSVEEQTLRDIEVIFVDDGSKDKSGAICDDVCRGKANMRVIHTRNQGSGPARNVGIAQAKGDYLYFFDIDDALEKNALQRMVSVARESDCDIVVCAFTRETENDPQPKLSERADMTVEGKYAREHYDKYMYGDACIQGAPWNKLFKRSFIVDNGVEYPDLRRNQDEVFIMRAMNYASKIRIISDVLYRHFSNTRERTLLKYRLDYDENVKRLYDYFEMIISWNPQNDEMRRVLGILFYMNMIMTMKVVFSPKWKLSFGEGYKEIAKRHNMYLDNCAKYGDPNKIAEITKSNYWPLIKRKGSFLLYAAMRLDTSRKLKAGAM